MKKKLTPQQKFLLKLYQEKCIWGEQAYQEHVGTVWNNDQDRHGKLFMLGLLGFDLPPYWIEGKPTLVQRNLVLKGYLTLTPRDDIKGDVYWEWNLTDKGRRWR